MSKPVEKLNKKINDLIDWIHNEFVETDNEEKLFDVVEDKLGSIRAEIQFICELMEPKNEN